jgi:hypothetical protein
MGKWIFFLNNFVVLTTKELMENLRDPEPKFLKYIRPGKKRDTKSGTAFGMHRSGLNSSIQHHLFIKIFLRILLISERRRENWIQKN